MFCALPGVAQELHSVSLAEHAQRAVSLRTLVVACRHQAAACDAEKVGQDERLVLANGVVSMVHYDWLRNALKEAKGAKDEDREETMAGVLARMDEAAPEGSPVDAGSARQQADAVLKDVEFAEARPSWFSRQWRRFTQWLGALFVFGVEDETTRSWIRLALELVLFSIPLALLGLWLRRQIREDRLMPESRRERAARRKTAETDWHEQAERAAAEGDWREAIHALYWLSITMFEERHVWSASRNRTPREYVALLEPGSQRRSLLREKTAMLETIWYGHREATEADYARAAALTEELTRA